MSFTDITYKDVEPSKYKDAIVKFRKLDGDLNERSKAIKSSSMTDTEAIELMEITSKDMYTTVKGVEQRTSFIEASERDKLLSLR